MGLRFVGRPIEAYSNSTSTVPELPTHKVGDYINLCVLSKATISSGTPTSSGGGTWQNSASYSSRGFYYTFFTIKCTSENETVSTITFSLSTGIMTCSFVTRGGKVNSANYINASATGDISPFAAMPRPNTTEPGTIIIHMGAEGNSAVPIPPIGTNYLGAGNIAAIAADFFVCGHYQASTGLSQSIPLPQRRSATAVLSVAIAPENTTYEVARADFSDLPAEIFYVGNGVNNADNTLGYWNFSALNPVFNGRNTAVATTNRTQGYGIWPNVTTDSWSTAKLDDHYYVYGFLARSAMNFSNRDLTIFARHDILNLGSVSNAGAFIVVGSSDTDWNAYTLTGNNAVRMPVNGAGYVIDLTNPSNILASSGSVDLSNVDRFAIGVLYTGAGSNNYFWRFGAIGAIEKFPIVGGMPSDANLDGGPANYEEIYQAIYNANLGSAEKQGSKQYRFLHPIQVGKTGADLYAEDTGFSVEFASLGTGFDTQYRGRKLSHTWNIPANKYCSLTDGLYFSESAWDAIFDIDPAATVDLSGNVIVNADFIFTQINSGNLDGVTLRNCGELPSIVTTSVGITVDACRDTQAVTISAATQAGAQTELDKLANYEFTNSTTYAVLVENTSAGDNWTLAIPGNTHIDKLRYRCAGGQSDATVTVPTTSSVGQATAEGDDTIATVTPINITLQGIPAGRPYRLFRVVSGAVVDSGVGTGSPIVVPFTEEGVALRCRSSSDQGIRVQQDFTTTTSDVAINMAGSTNPFRAVDDATALAYNAATIVGNTSVTYNTTATIQQTYDYVQAWANSATGLEFDIPQTTADGTIFLLTNSYTHVVNAGQIVEESKEWSGTFTVSNGGVFEDANGLIWESGGNVRKATHFRINTRSIADESVQQNTVVAFIETDTDTDVTYNTSRVAGALTSDVNGNVEGYAVHTLNGVPYGGHQQLALNYGFDPFSVPVTLTGAPIGSVGNFNIIRMVVDPYVFLSRTAALAVVGITVNHSSSTINHNSEVLSNVADNIKARQFRSADIEAGKPGHMSFYEVGKILEDDGSFYNSATGWRHQNVGGTGTLKGGILELGTPGDINLDLNGLTIDYTTAGTYDHRGDSITTLTLGNSSGGAVIAQFDNGVNPTNNGPNITVENSLAITLTAPNLIDGSRAYVYNFTQDAPLTNQVISGGGGLSLSLTYGIGEEVAPNDRIDLVATYQNGSIQKLPVVDSRTATGGNIVFTNTQEDDVELNNLCLETGWTADALDKDLNPVTGEISADFANVQIDVNDPDNLFDVRKGVLWFAYACTTATGVAIYNPKALVRSPDIRNIVVEGPIQVENIKASKLKAFGGIWVRSDGQDIIADSSNTIHWVPDGRVYQSPLIETGVSGLTAQESLELGLITTVNDKVSEIHIANDLDATKPQTYADDGSSIANADFTRTKSDNGNGTFSIVKS